MKRVVLIGAGPAGLTAAWELLTSKIPVEVTILESTEDIGGISRTVVYHGNRMDIGGHRFFSKSDRVMEWWRRLLPLQGTPGADPDKVDDVMLVRNRLSRILYLRKFFNYPVSLSVDTLSNLGFFRVMRIGFSYMKVRLLGARREKSLEDFFINRFGVELYKTFFKDYTEKVWGVKCSDIKPEWGAQRIKGLSITGAIIHAVKKIFGRKAALGEKGVETSLIEQFLYPKFGPGHLWETVAKQIQGKGGRILMQHKVVRFERNADRVTAVVCTTPQGEVSIPCDECISSMPLQDLVRAMPDAPKEVQRVSEGLCYRDFITVGLLLNKLAIKNKTDIPTPGDIVPDNWIYVQERDVRIGRLQIFNNWSPYLVADPSKVWMGLEYFCQEGDDLWTMSDKDFAHFASAELEKIGVAYVADVIDSVVIRVPKTYPAYFGTYEEFPILRAWLDSFANLWCVGRNGQHRYNNQDHSMLSAIAAAESIIAGRVEKAPLWEINTEAEYHESKKTA